MREIIQGELDSPIPVVVYVYPDGARAASAGVYILMASDVAAMAPQTNLGAATPVALGGTMDETMKAKVTNDAAAYIVALAKNHGRNAEWAEEAVRKSVSLTAEQALAMNVVDFVEPDLPTLLTAMDGFVTEPKGLVLHTAGAPVEEVEMGWITTFLHAIANPDIAYILMTLGILGIIFEISSPGLGAAGIGGVIALLLSFYGLAVLPVNFVGIALIVVAIILFVAEIKVQSQRHSGDRRSSRPHHRRPPSLRHLGPVRASELARVGDRGGGGAGLLHAGGHEGARGAAPATDDRCLGTRGDARGRPVAVGPAGAGAGARRDLESENRRRDPA